MEAGAAINAKITLPVRKAKEHFATLRIRRGTIWIAKALARIHAEM
jgi:hypothetical protein